MPTKRTKQLQASAFISLALDAAKKAHESLKDDPDAPHIYLGEAYASLQTAQQKLEDLIRKES